MQQRRLSTAKKKKCNKILHCLKFSLKNTLKERDDNSEWPTDTRRGKRSGEIGQGAQKHFQMYVET